MTVFQKMAEAAKRIADADPKNNDDVIGQMAKQFAAIMTSFLNNHPDYGSAVRLLRAQARETHDKPLQKGSNLT